MKILLLAIACFPGIAKVASGQRTAEGYIIGLNNDSISVVFKLPKAMSAPMIEMYGQPFDFFHLKDEVEVMSAAGETMRFTPRDIKKFEFSFKSEKYKFESKPINHYQRNFLLPEVTGPRIKLYNYTIIHQGTAYHGNGMKAKGGSAPWKQYFWTFEKPDGSYLFVNSGMRKREIVMMMKRYFNDSQLIQRKIDEQFRGWFVNIPSAVREIAESYAVTP